MYPVIQYIMTLDPVYAVCAIGMWVAHIITSVVKILTHSHFPELPWVRRPDGASNCDIMCRNGDRSGAPGFPSGHMSHATFFCTFIIMLAYKNNLPQAHLVTATGICFIALTAIARYKKKCHDPVQIVAGTLLGGLLGFIFFKIAHAFN